MRDGKCHYCSETKLGKNIWNEGKCRNCGAGLKNTLIRDKANQFVCRYCGWPVIDKPVEDTLRSPSSPSDPDPLPPNSPSRTIHSSSSGVEFGEDFELSHLIPLVFSIFIAVVLVGPLLTAISKTSSNITTTNHQVDVPTYSLGSSIILLGGAFAAGIILTFAILRNRHRRE